jgi:hypothetical protein
MKQIIVTPPNSLNEKTKAILISNNIILIECENPQDVRVIGVLDQIKGDDLIDSIIMPLLDANIATTDTALKRISRNILNVIVKKPHTK